MLSDLPEEKLRIHEWILENSFHNLDVVTQAIEGFPYGVYSKELEKKAVPEIVRIGKAFADQVDVVAVSCVADPGVKELRRVISIPVVGAGSALGCVVKAIDESHVGVMTLGDYVPEALMRALSGLSITWRKVAGVSKTTDLREAQDPILEAARWLAAHGCRIIALACTGFSTVGTAALISKSVPCIVVDPVMALGAVIVGAFGNNFA